jgi:asparagine N-glycosylation enzyme membrane subunit Stt3
MSKNKLELPVDRDNGYHPFFIIMVILLFHITIFITNYESIINQISIRDFDGYWHLLRVESLYKTGNVFDTVLSRSNAPYGESIHWTRAFDLILYAGAYAGSFFVDFKTALLLWSIIVNPVLHILTFLVLFWGFRELVGDAIASIFGIIFPFQPYLTFIFDIGVPDHHGAVIFVFSLFIALVIKSLLRENWKVYSVCGIVGGISIWFSIENMAVILIALFVFGLQWVLEGKNYQNNNLLFSFFLLSATLLSMLIDTKFNELLNIEYDRRSIVHVFLWLITAIFWLIVVFLSKYSKFFEKRTARIITAVIGAFACIFLMNRLFPLFYKNPLSDIDPAIKLLYLKETPEFSGLFSGRGTISQSAVAYWVITLFGIPISIYLTIHNYSKKRYAWIFLVFLVITFIILSAFTFRMITYSILCSLIPISYAIYQLYILVSQKIRYPYNVMFRTFFIVVCCFSFLILPSLVFPSKKNIMLLYNRYFLSSVCQYLNEDPFFADKPQRILTSIYWGTLLLYKTQHEVIGTPSHRNVSGILDTYYVMNALNEEDAHKIICRRGIKVLVIGKIQNGIGDFFIQDIQSKNKSDQIFHHQLWNGSIPPWLQTYGVPKNLEGKIKVFRVLR